MHWMGTENSWVSSAVDSAGLLDSSVSSKLVCFFFRLRCTCPHWFFHIFISSDLWCASWRSKRHSQCICVTGKNNEITVTSRPVITVGNWQQQQQQADQRGSQPEKNQADAITGTEAMFHVIFRDSLIHSSNINPLFQNSQWHLHGSDFIVFVNYQPCYRYRPLC